MRVTTGEGITDEAGLIDKLLPIARRYAEWRRELSQLRLQVPMPSTEARKGRKKRRKA